MHIVDAFKDMCTYSHYLQRHVHILVKHYLAPVWSPHIKYDNKIRKIQRSAAQAQYAINYSYHSSESISSLVT